MTDETPAINDKVSLTNHFWSRVPIADQYLLAYFPNAEALEVLITEMSRNAREELKFPAQTPRFSVDQIEAEIARRRAAGSPTDDNPA